MIINLKVYTKSLMLISGSSVGGQETNVVAEYMIKILGLEVCADTVVGDEMFRGISGGQRKLVTAGEILVGSVRALFMDEISNGGLIAPLHSRLSTLPQTGCSLHPRHILSGMAIISLLQPASKTYNLFDDIILLSDGQIVYHGPSEDVLDFFESMGFR